MALRLVSKLLVVGDSISYGEHLSRRTRDAWPYLIGRETGHDIVNLSGCGDTTRKALERAQLWQPCCRGAVVFVQFGLNDANRWASDKGLPRVSLPTIARAWGFEPRGEIIWGLRNVGMGTRSIANDHEPALIATRGRVSIEHDEPLGVWFFRQVYEYGLWKAALLAGWGGPLGFPFEDEAIAGEEQT